MALKIGIPRGLLYYVYGSLWKNFFINSNIEIIESISTNKQILNEGILNSIDEACLSSKIFMGHVKYLIGKCDYILLPKINLEKNFEGYCPQIMGMPDVVKNTLGDCRILEFEFSHQGYFGLKSFKKLGKTLNIKTRIVKSAYKKAMKTFELEKETAYKKQQSELEKDNIKILMASHPYNLYDSLVGAPVVDFLRKNGIIVAFANINSGKYEKKAIDDLSGSRDFWKTNMSLAGGIEEYRNKVDGIILFSAFPCGPDALINEMFMRKIEDKPIISIIADGSDSDTGLITRLESFIDILQQKKLAALSGSSL